MINEKILSEKLNYLLMMEGKPKFEIFSVRFEGEYEDWEKKDTLISYDIDINFDYNGKIDESPSSMGYDIKTMSNLMGNLIGQFPITKQGKIQKNYDIYIDEGVIFKFDYELDQKHLFDMSFKIMYPE